MQSRVATTITDYQHIRKLRNAVRNFMTSDRSIISEEQQFSFYRLTYAGQDRDHVDIYMHYSQWGSFVGYSLLTRRGDKWYGTLAVDEEFRGQGYGTAIYKHMQACAEEIWLEIYSDNRASFISASKAGFTIDGLNDGRLIMVWRKSA